MDSDESNYDRMEIKYRKVMFDDKKKSKSFAHLIDSPKFVDAHINLDRIIDDIEGGYKTILCKINKGDVLQSGRELSVINNRNLLNLGGKTVRKLDNEIEMANYLKNLKKQLKKYFQVLNKYSLEMFSLRFDIQLTNDLLQCIEQGNHIKRLLADINFKQSISKSLNLSSFLLKYCQIKKIESSVKTIDDILLKMLYLECNSLLILFIYHYNQHIHNLAKEILYERTLESIGIWFDIIFLLNHQMPKWLFYRYKSIIKPYIQYNIYCSLLYHYKTQAPQNNVLILCRKVIDSAVKYIPDDDNPADVLELWKNELLTELDVWLVKDARYFGNKNKDSKKTNANIAGANDNVISDAKNSPVEQKERDDEVDYIFSYLSFKNFIYNKSDNSSITKNNDFYIAWFKYIVLSFVLSWGWGNKSLSENMMENDDVDDNYYYGNDNNNRQKIYVNFQNSTAQLARQLLKRKSTLTTLLKLSLMINIYILSPLINTKTMSKKILLNDIEDIITTELKNALSPPTTSVTCNKTSDINDLLILILTLAKRLTFATTLFLRIYDIVIIKNLKANSVDPDRYCNIKDLYEDHVFDIGYIEKLYRNCYCRYTRYCDLKKLLDQSNYAYIIPLLSYATYLNEKNQENYTIIDPYSSHGLFGAFNSSDSATIHDHSQEDVSIGKKRKRYISLLLSNIKNHNDADVIKGIKIDKLFLIDYLLLVNMIMICKTSNVLLKTIYHKLKTFIIKLHNSCNLSKGIMLNLHLEFIIYIKQDTRDNNINNLFIQQDNYNNNEENNTLDFKEFLIEMQIIIGYLLNGYLESSNLYNTMCRVYSANDLMETNQILVEKFIEKNITKVTKLFQENYDLIVMHDIPLVPEINYYSILNSQTPYLPGIREVFLDLLDILLMDSQDFKKLLIKRRTESNENTINHKDRFTFELDSDEVDYDLVIDIILRNEKEDKILMNKFKLLKINFLKNSNRSCMDFLKLFEDITRCRYLICS